MYQFDVNNDFLYVDFDEEVFMEQLSGYLAQGEMACRLKKVIYGLKRSP